MSKVEPTQFTDSALADLMKEFFTQYKDVNGKFKYVEMIDETITKSSIVISTKDILQSKLKESIEVYDVLMKEPERFIKATKRAVKEIYKEKSREEKKINIHVDEVERKPSIVEALGNDFINDIVTMTGMVVSKSSVYNIPEEIHYRCRSNHMTTIINLTNKIPKPPLKCSDPKCSERELEAIPKKKDIQKHRTISLKSDEEFSFQDDEIEIELQGDLIDIIEAGDRVQLTGIVKFDIIKTVYVNWIQCLYIKKLDDVDLNISAEDEEFFKHLADEHDFYQKMILSVSPSTLGWYSIKESLLLQRIGSPSRTQDDGTVIRGWLHVGLFGDAGVAKTKLGEWEVTNLPRTQIVGSKGASGKGLLLGLEDNATGKKTLRAGAFINCRNGGVVVLDEFPRLGQEIIDELMTTLESGYASISKTGHQAKVNANASLLATGNAYGEQWDESQNLKDNLNLQITLLQRLDYTWIMLDNFDQDHDAKIADAIIGGIDYSDVVEPYNPIILAKYIKFVQRFNPELGDEVKKHIKESYLELRKSKDAKSNGISPRHLNTLIRTTLAITRLYQRQYATLEDVDKAISLIKQMFKQRNISISEADTYIIRQYNRCMQVLHDAPKEGLRIDEMFKKLLTADSAEDIAQTIIDLGRNPSTYENKKLREVVEKLKRSPLITIISLKPIVLAYRKDKGVLDSWK